MTLSAVSSLLQEPPERHEPPRRKTLNPAFQQAMKAQKAGAGDEGGRPAGAPRCSSPRAGTIRRDANASARGLGEREQRTPLPHGTGAGRGGADADGAFPPPYGQGGGSGGAGQQGGMAGNAAAMAGLGMEGELDLDSLLDLLPNDGQSGIFELLLPDGATLGVVADFDARQATFLLTPSSEKLRALLNKRKMELEKGLAQRMDRYVGLTVL